MISEIAMFALDVAGFAFAWRQHRILATPVITGIAYGFTAFLALDFIRIAFSGLLSADAQLFLDLGQNSSAAVTRIIALAILVCIEDYQRDSGKRMRVDQ